MTWTLTPRPDVGTDLKLVHHGFRPDHYAFGAVTRGWKAMLPDLSQALKQPV